MTLPIDSTAHEELDYPPPSDYMDTAPMPRGHAEAIDALRELANWLQAHPDVPAPVYIDIQAHVYGPLEPALDRLAAFTATHGGERKQHGNVVWAERAWTGTEKLKVTYRATVTLPGSRP